MKKFKFIVQYVIVWQGQDHETEKEISVRAWTYEGAVRKALYVAHKVVRSADAVGEYAFMRLCKER